MESSPNPTEISVSLGVYCKSSRLEIIFEYKSISNSKMFPIKLLFSLNRSNQNPQEVSLRYHPSHPIFCRWTNSKGGTLWSFNLRLGWHVATWLGRHHEDDWKLVWFFHRCQFTRGHCTIQGISLCPRKSLGRNELKNWELQFWKGGVEQRHLDLLVEMIGGITAVIQMAFVPKGWRVSPADRFGCWSMLRWLEPVSRVFRLNYEGCLMSTPNDPKNSWKR